MMQITPILLIGGLWLTSVVSGQACPSTSGYIQCAKQYENCDVPDSIKQGYISYGVDGRWLLIPFTNNRGNFIDLEYLCNDDGGDPYPGISKYCCYTNQNIDTGFNADDFKGIIPFDHNGHGGHISFWIESFGQLRYGADNQYVYRPIFNTLLHCDTSDFGDAAPGSDNDCGYKNSAPDSISSIDENDWVICANEDGICEGLDQHSTHWVRYGGDDKYVYQLVISRYGSIDCRSDVFSDAFSELSGSSFNKNCYRSPAQYTFTSIVGQWARVPICTGCENSIKVIEGISDTVEREISSAWGSSFTRTASAGFRFLGFGANVEVSGTKSREVILTTFEQNTMHKEVIIEKSCDKGYLYQWVTNAIQNNGINEQLFQYSTGVFFCSPSSNIPKCLPYFCVDDDEECQSCKSDGDGRRLMAKEGPNNENNNTEYRPNGLETEFYLYFGDKFNDDLLLR